jgi:Cd2+/Zn2+-exporting ATPase
MSARPTSDSGLAAAPVRSRFRVGDDSCLDCAGDVPDALGRLPGVHAVQVASQARVVLIDHQPGIRPDDLRRQAARLGLILLPDQAAPPAPQASTPWWRQPRIITIGVAAALLLLGLATDQLGLPRVADVLYLATVAIGSVPTGRIIYQSLRAGRFTLSTLLIAAFGAIAIGLLEEAAVLTVVFSTGQVLEEYASSRVRRSIHALMALAPPVAQRLAPDGSLQAVPVEDLQPGEQVLVRPGERLPTDGTIVQGSSAVDQSPVTGESVPVEVTAGSTVFAGTVNGAGALRVQVTKHYADTTLARIIRQVEEAQASKGRAQRFADRFGAVYAPIMLGLAATVALVPPLLVGDWRGWFYRALVVLVVSCSCALLISVPVSVVAAITRAARAGILIKGGAYLEALGGLRVVVFDKTGTLTRGLPEVTDIVTVGDRQPDEVLGLAAQVEAASEHPLADAVLRAAATRGLPTTPAADLRAIHGVGVQATVSGQRVFVGRPDPANAQAGTDGLDERIARLEEAGKTTMLVTVDSRPVGLLAVADRLRDQAPAAMASLRQVGVDRLVMLTGDNQRVAAAIAGHVGVDEWRAGLLPQDKTAAVTSLRADYGRIAMVGDGVNDAPALATADIGIAMGAAGSDVALETADIALMTDDLGKVTEAIRLSRHALVNIRQNIIMSLATVAVLVTAALTGWLSLTTGLLLNEATALLIIGNGLRLSRLPTEHLTSPPTTQAAAGHSGNEQPHQVTSMTLAAAATPSDEPGCCAPQGDAQTGDCGC